MLNMQPGVVQFIICFPWIPVVKREYCFDILLLCMLGKKCCGLVSFGKQKTILKLLPAWPLH